MLNPNKRGVSPVIAIVLLLMMTVAAAGAAYFWLTSMQSSVQQSAGSQIEAITKQASTRIIAQATLCKPPAEDDLVGYWKFDKGEGTTAEDSAGGNDGTLKNGTEECSGGYCPTWISTRYGTAIRFDGNGDKVEIPDDQSLRIENSNWTIEALVNTTGGGDIVAKYAPYKLRVVSSGELNGLVWNGSEAVVDTRSDTLVNDSKWHRLVWTMNRQGYSKLYIDGNTEGSEDISDYTDQDWSGTDTLEIPSGSYFKGEIAWVRIYDSFLEKEKAVALKEVRITVYNAGTEEVPKGAWVANLKKDGTTVDSDSYNASKLPPEERITLHFYFDKMKPGKEYKIELEGTQTSTTVSC